MSTKSILKEFSCSPEKFEELQKAVNGYRDPRITPIKIDCIKTPLEPSLVDSVDGVLYEFVGVDLPNSSDCDIIQDVVIKTASETGYSFTDVAESIGYELSKGLNFHESIEQLDLASRYTEAYLNLEKLSNSTFASEVKELISSRKEFYGTEFEIKRVGVACQLLQRGASCQDVLLALKNQAEVLLLKKDTLISEQGMINLQELARETENM